MCGKTQRILSEKVSTTVHNLSCLIFNLVGVGLSRLADLISFTTGIPDYLDDDDDNDGVPDHLDMEVKEKSAFLGHAVDAIMHERSSLFFSSSSGPHSLPSTDSPM